jgi:branched-subunit amino acid aminotransferase/4-amino-4-deoxychorismate lyase
MSEPLAYLDGQLVPQSQARLALNDAGFVLGATVTDLCRTFGQRLYAWPAHLARFRDSCRSIHLKIALQDLAVTRIAEELVERNAELLPDEGELCLVLFATPGTIGYYLGEAGSAGDRLPTFGMHTFALPWARYRRLVSEGADLLTPKVRQVRADSVGPRIKHRSRLHWWLADREVQAIRPGAQALLLNEHDHITETAAANLLLVRAGAVHAPKPNEVLGGISLQILRGLCGLQEIPFHQQSLTLDDCAAADEALLTSTPYCLAPVKRINDITYPSPGPVTRRLHAAWSEVLGGLDIWAQFHQHVG